MDQIYIDVPFGMHYDIKNGIPIHEAIDQLKAINKIIDKQKSVISIVANAEIEHTEVFITELKEGSWIEEVCIRIFFENKEHYEKFAQAAGGVPLEMWMKVILSMGVGAFLTYGLLSMLGKIGNSSGTTINIKNNSGIISLGESIGLTESQIDTVIEKNAKQSKSDKQATLDVLNPAKNGGASKVAISGLSELDIVKEDFEDLPEEVPNQDNEEKEQDYDAIDVYIYASDRDKTSTGWAGIVPELFEQRVKFELADGVDPNTLHGRRKVKADITVHNQYVKSRKAFKAYKVTIRAVD
jgi:hypothetical protein